MIPTTRALWLAAFSLVPAGAALLEPRLAPVLLAFDLCLLALVGLDARLAPGKLDARRVVEPILSAGRTARVTLQLTGDARGELRDFVSPGPLVNGHARPFEVRGALQLTYEVTPLRRGPLHFGPLTVRLEGPLGLASRQQTVPLFDEVKVFPDLAALSFDALTLARAEAQAAPVQRVRTEGGEFESLREYRVGDDRRSIDWKATARRGKALVRRYQPERNQQVVLLLDCGRHMTGLLEGRQKLDHAVDAALRLAKVALDQGDLVGVLAFAGEVKAWLPPRRGQPQLRALARALYRVEATWEESDVGAALDVAFARGARRSLVVVLTDLFDAGAARVLVTRTAALAPRHLPLVISLQDDEVQRAATALPEHPDDALERFAATRLERETERVVGLLRAGGAKVVRGPPSRFAGAGVSAYLDLKARGAL